MKNKSCGETGCLSDCEYVILIIFHLSGGWRDVTGDGDKVEGWMKGRLKDRRGIFIDQGRQ